MSVLQAAHLALKKTCFFAINFQKEYTMKHSSQKIYKQHIAIILSGLLLTIGIISTAQAAQPVEDCVARPDLCKPNAGHAIKSSKTPLMIDVNTATEQNEQQPQQTARGIKDQGVKSCSGCGMTGKVKTGDNPQATTKDTVGATEAGGRKHNYVGHVTLLR
jgi:hypothetical protein